MAQDIRDLFKNDNMLEDKMPANHQDRFLEKLNTVLPKQQKKTFSWLQIAASLLLLIGLSFGAYKYFSPNTNNTIPVKVVDVFTEETKTLGDVSPGLKKVEDYYLANINLELAKMKPTAETKDLFDGYLEQLNGLNTEYKRLSKELTVSGPNELMVNALIDNLKMRLNLLYRLREKATVLGKEVENSSKSI